MQELHAALLALQETDDLIASTQARIDEFAPRLAELEAPVTRAVQELELTRAKLEELRTELRRIEKNAAQKRERLAAQEERLMKVRNAREESAARAEMDLVRKALAADTADVKQLSEQATRTDLKVDDIQRQVDRIRSDIGAQREELIAARTALETELAQLQQQRENQAVRVDPPSRRLYERVRGGRSRTALAKLTDEGACGNCYSVLPVQEQTQVRRGETLHRCEQCGVILYSP